MKIIVAILIGFIIGVIAQAVTSKPKSSGIIYVTRPSPDEEEYLFLELKAPVDEVMSRNVVIFDVVSQKEQAL